MRRFNIQQLPTGSYSISGSFTGSFTGSFLGTASFAQTASFAISSSQAQNAQTASFLNTLNQDLTFNGNLTLNGTASISTLVVNQTQYSSGSNQLGDGIEDTQTLFGTVVIPTGSLTVSGALAISSSQNSYFIGSGNVGIGITNPTSRLQVKGSGTTSATTSFRVENANASGSMVVLDNGNVGIGTTTPNAKLDVNGNTIITGSLQASGSISSTTLIGSDNRVVVSDPSGTLQPTNQIIIQTYIDPNGGQAGLLNTTSNWDIYGIYQGVPITDTFQGQKHYNTNYFFEAIDDNSWIRLIRG